MERTIIKTADGSHSLYVKDLNEHYHSVHGAIQESTHVFINAGLKYVASQNPSSITILEVGFGTGLNALLSFLEAEQLGITIHYTALEAYPLNNALTNELNYSQILCPSPPHNSVFTILHSCKWEKEISISGNFTLLKIKNDLQQVVLNNLYNLIYFDAFAPLVQPELWKEEIFSKLVAVTKSSGCLVTYCAKGEVKRTLKKLGYSLESLPGPPGKREMVRATKNL